MKLHYIKFQKTALHIAITNNNEEIVQLLLSVPNIDVNMLSIFKHQLS